MTLPRHSPAAFFLVGPTASGKTALAQWLAERHDLDVLSADAMLVYRGMDIGTAKPTPAERARVRYWGLDLAAPDERFSVADYRAAAVAALAAAAAAGRRVIVAGGSGLYLKSLTDGLAPRPPPDPELRARADRLLAEGGVGALQDWLRRLSPEALQTLPDPRNPRRLVRAIESALAGRTSAPRSWRPPGAGPRIPGLLWPREALYALIRERTARMFAGGLLEEVRALAARGLARAPTALQAIGYAEALDCLAGRCDLETARARTELRTRRLAKRQLTWFRQQAQVDWIELSAGASADDCARRVWDYWREHGPVPLAEPL